MRRFLLLGALLLASLPAQAEQACQPVDAVLAGARAEGHSVAQVLEPEAIAIYSRLYNMQPPVSTTVHTQAFLVILPDGMTVIALGSNGLLCDTIAAPTSRLQELIRAALGQAL